MGVEVAVRVARGRRISTEHAVQLMMEFAL